MNDEYLSLLKSILKDGRSFRMIRSIFISKLPDNDETIKYWYKDGRFLSMRLYKYICALGYRKDGTVLRKKVQ
ncbi:hypothetical protein [Mycobacterium sp.]|uniref:hypothetical protein n=1 Tax=Mycobacterium sp. TaxID=1785 RepID=UPI0031CE7398